MNPMYIIASLGLASITIFILLWAARMISLFKEVTPGPEVPKSRNKQIKEFVHSSGYTDAELGLGKNITRDSKGNIIYPDTLNKLRYKSSAFGLVEEKDHTSKVRNQIMIICLTTGINTAHDYDGVESPEDELLYLKAIHEYIIKLEANQR